MSVFCSQETLSSEAYNMSLSPAIRPNWLVLIIADTYLYALAMLCQVGIVFGCVCPCVRVSVCMYVRAKAGQEAQLLQR